VGSGDDELEQRLANLQMGEFIYEQPAAGDSAYTFKHALTQEVAYNSILLERRKQIHEKAAQAIEALYATNLVDHYEDLAHHYSRSGSALKAACYLHLAAEFAMNRSAYTEASARLTTALELLQREPDSVERDQRELNVRLSLGICMMLGMKGGLVSLQVRDMLERAHALCENVGDERTLFQILENLSFQLAAPQSGANLTGESRKLWIGDFLRLHCT
jgi:hypothetical protein